MRQEAKIHHVRMLFIRSQITEESQRFAPNKWHHPCENVVPRLWCLDALIAEKSWEMPLTTACLCIAFRQQRFCYAPAHETFGSERTEHQHSEGFPLGSMQPGKQYRDVFLPASTSWRERFQ